MVTEAMTYLDKMPNKDETVKLINTLRTITDGKVRCNHRSAREHNARARGARWLVLLRALDVGCPPQIYVEVERARLTLMLSRILEADGNVKEASETLQEVAVRGTRLNWLRCRHGTPHRPVLLSVRWCRWRRLARWRSARRRSSCWSKCDCASRSAISCACRSLRTR